MKARQTKNMRSGWLGFLARTKISPILIYDLISLSPVKFSYETDIGIWIWMRSLCGFDVAFVHCLRGVCAVLELVSISTQGKL